MRPALGHGLARAALAMALVALAACSTVPEQGNFDPKLFPPTAAAAIFDGRVALLTDPASLKQEVLGERLADGGPVRVPIGRIVHEASLVAFGEAFKGGALTIDDIAGAPSRQTPVVAVRVADYAYRDRLQYLIPTFLPQLGFVIDVWQLDVRLVVEARLLAAEGTMLWSSTFDSGLQIWKQLRDSPLPIPLESRAEGLLRQTHETAVKLLRQAADDVGRWLREEQRRERQL